MAVNLEIEKCYLLQYAKEILKDLKKKSSQCRKAGWMADKVHKHKKTFHNIVTLISHNHLLWSGLQQRKGK